MRWNLTEEKAVADKIRVLLTEEEVNKKISEVAAQINKDYEGKEVHLICILKGGVFFTCELAKYITVPVTIDFMSVSSYGNSMTSSGSITISQDLIMSLENREVLIIEDDNDIRELLKEEIGTYFEVEVAVDGTSGFEKARTYDADLIICDVLMPGMSGFEVTKRLKSDFATSHIPIILLTALSSPEKQLEGIESGADAYISKPFSIKFLLARAFRLIEQREKLREKFSNEPGIIHAAMYSTDRDKEFTDRLDIVLKANISRSDFSVEEFAQLMKLGRTVFYKKIRGITGYSPNEYLRIMRMKKAAELLLSEEHLTVAEVAYKVGINDPFYFSKCFKGQFGISPSVYQKGGEKTREEPE